MKTWEKIKAELLKSWPFWAASFVLVIIFCFLLRSILRIYHKRCTETPEQPIELSWKSKCSGSNSGYGGATRCLFITCGQVVDCSMCGDPHSGSIRYLPRQC